jgi:hypothetical protein
MAALAALVLHTCLQIEVRNYLLGGFLPRDPSPEPGVYYKWRVLGGRMAERVWREQRRRSITQDPALPEPPLSQQEKRELEAFVAREEALASLKGWCEGMGLLQYLLAPLLLILSIAVAVTTRSWPCRAAALICWVVSAISTWSMLDKDYFGSLGW